MQHTCPPRAQHHGRIPAQRTTPVDEQRAGIRIVSPPRIVDVPERGGVLADGGRGGPRLAVQLSLGIVTRFGVFAQEAEGRPRARPPLADEVVRLGAVQPSLLPIDKSNI
ncbi:hypothetical protein DICSQDRAFT_137113 [Dichomitus squalens LYAD-421 SS1]|uniref:Uncharacterized protein n=2 Tax=Dichomitus squalens TaxID=114155 RepID=A0A4V2JZZ5_9APHY|nr:uncharacterized protein DICSQDRAFT_137113 [Dichomitus squalens LYAD-421 SS1]EJF60888.1 hypothetical protein DICSQDRAFT_137113 [Dichomitus squalens LYAD-421 SS1]TBU26943.1 hypothetical protein BD311DRAFT_846860 [Dichomitus squalens]